MAGRILSSLLILVFLVSCATGGFKDRQGARTFFQEGKYTEALSSLQSSSEYKEERSRLLLPLEQGMIFHAEGKFKESIQAFDSAKKIAKELFTVSVSKKAESLLVSEVSDNYYGEAYELSLIHFYLALNHYLLYQLDPTAPTARTELFSARAEILEWDSLLTTMKNERMGETVFKNDLLAKVFGGMIHEALDTRNDDQIALQLYKDALDVLFKNYNSYKSFNMSATAFKKDYKKLPELPVEEIKKNYVAETAYQRELKNFLETKILLLTKILRPRDLATVAKQIGAGDSLLKSLEKQKSKNNISIVLEKGMIPLKAPELYYFSLGKGAQESEGAKAFAKIGATVLTMFAAEKLGLMPAPSNWNPSATAIGLNVAAFAVENLAISFELPKMENLPTQGNVILEISDAKGVKLREENLYLVNPIGDMAEEAVAEHASWLYSRVGTRLAAKHLTAIAASYATYRALGGGSDQGGDFFAKNAAVIQYVGASKLIEQTEKADTRFWSTLPHDIRLADFSLPAGSYQFKLLVKENDQVLETRDLGKFEVKAADKKTVLNIRTKG